ncbi:uncharacterized protein LOC122383934 [Amphibalanus amphitrite]|nr:uncharacterized protein LOC122383934 [Amphibalanus amphitrite]
MHRNVSVTTHLLHPVSPPLWFRAVFYAAFAAWVALQAATEYFTITSLYTYTHLPLFESEKQVNSAFLNIVAVGLLTVFVVLTFIYGVVAKSKLAVLASAAFLASLIILNVLAVGILMSSKFSLNTGPSKFGQRVLTIYHPNVSAAHWSSELDQWAAAYPARPEPPPADPQAGQQRLLHLLDYFQQQGGCCGVLSYRDYAARGALLATSCRCLPSGHGRLRPQCTGSAHLLADGSRAPLWSRGCQLVTDDFLRDLFYLRDLLISTVVFQVLVLLLGIVLGLNTPIKAELDDADHDSDG